MNKLTSWIDAHFDELLSMKTLLIVFLVVLNIILLCGSHYLIVRSDVAHAYIKELEQVIDDDIMDTIIEGDTYHDYYSYE